MLTEALRTLLSVQTKSCGSSVKGLRERDAATQPRTSGNWWCTCGHCEAMATQQECLCCREWDLLRRDTKETLCFVQSEDFPSLINRAVLETFFHVPKINWRQRPRPDQMDSYPLSKYTS